MPKAPKSQAKRDNLFFLTGENDFELLRFLRKWEVSSIKKYGEYNVSRFDYSSKKEVSEIISEINSPPFFGDGKRVFLIENFPPPPVRSESSEKRKKAALALAQSLTTVPEECVVILASSNPDKRTTPYKLLFPLFADVKTFPGWAKDQRSGRILPEGLRQASGWIMEEGKGKGLSLNSETAHFLVEYCGADPWKLHAELEKLCSFKEAVSREITKADIETLCLPSEEMSNFAFSNAVQTGDISAILSIFDQLVSSGEAPQAILARDLIPTLRQLLLVRSALDSGKAAAESSLHPFVFEKLKAAARRLKLVDLFVAHKSLTQLDVDSKIGKIPLAPDRVELFRLVVERIFITLFLDSPFPKSA